MKNKKVNWIDCTTHYDLEKNKRVFFDSENRLKRVVKYNKSGTSVIKEVFFMPESNTSIIEFYGDWLPIEKLKIVFHGDYEETIFFISNKTNSAVKFFKSAFSKQKELTESETGFKYLLNSVTFSETDEYIKGKLIRI